MAILTYGRLRCQLRWSGNIDFARSNYGVYNIEIMKTFKLITLLALLIVLVSGALACAVTDEEAIQQTVTGFFTAYENREYSRCLEFLSERLKAGTGEAEIIETLRTAQALGDFTKLKSMGELEIGSTTATVWVDIEGFAGIVKTVQVSLVKEDGEWKIHTY